jgi:hypothetical protein
MWRDMALRAPSTHCYVAPGSFSERTAYLSGNRAPAAHANS